MTSVSMPRSSVVRIFGHGAWAIALLALAVLAGVAIGETSISLPVIVQVLANKLWTAGFPLDPID
jgi:iron complex transport system permease protein